MPIELRMPALSPTMEEGTLAKWLVKVGQTVASGDILAEIETDKATMEFEAVDEGVITAISVAEGTEGVKVGTVIATLAGEGEDQSATATPAATPTKIPTPAVAAPAIAPVVALSAPVVAAAKGVRVVASPLAKRIAAQAGVDLHSVPGSGPGGRIVKADVEAAASGAGPRTTAAVPAAGSAVPAFRSKLKSSTTSARLSPGV